MERASSASNEGMGHEGYLAACLQRVRARDEEASRELVEHLYPLVEKIVRAHLPRSEEVEDLTQEVFLKLFARLDQYRRAVPFEHWVSRVTISTCIDRLRAQRRRPVCVWSDLSKAEQNMIESLSSAEGAKSEWEAAASELLDRLLPALSPPERLLIQLLELEQRSIAEVCAATGWNSGVVRIRAFRARRKLRALYQKLEQGKL
ncbi:MAG: RNA polymerase sigma factor [Verrucomicrobiales bacterium]|nr:RNA polymerase sigma factor [Verrucomicrobiales bacterium]